MERSLVLIKPDGVEKKVIGKIISMYESENLEVKELKLLTASEETAKKHYAEHKERPFFNELISFITRGPICALIIEGRDAIRRVRELNGDTNPLKAKEGTIRNLYGSSIGENCVHSSDSMESSKREVEIWFNL
ncbi:MAG: nucleoside-diphosphate kinase [Clostridium sp.]|uniref:nucleoside-diphosphate kinase n=1 Tax=Clostridium sp. TaxID=1506 RepID=UPI003EE62A43